MSSSKPVHEETSWPLKASVWENESDKGTFYSLTLERSYKDADGNWKNSASLSRRDWLAGARLLERAHDWADAQDAEAQRQKAAND